MLKEQVKNLLDETETDVKNCFFQSEVDDNSKGDDYFDGLDEFCQSCRELGINFKHEDNFGGKGMGDDYWSVYSFFQGEEKVFVKFSGWYQSYNGSEYTDWFFVEPKQKTITVFEKA